MIMKNILLIFFFCISVLANAQELIIEDNDTNTMTEYNDGRLWAYKQIDQFVVGMTTYT